MSLYTSLLRPLLFLADPEKVHNFSISMGESMGYLKPVLKLIQAVYNFEDERLESRIGGLLFKNPLGLAAGYDKSGHSIPFLESLGFSHVEIGSVSAERSPGNPKPRMFRLPEDKALIVHYGLQNDGSEVVAERLGSIKRRRLLGINIVKTNRGIDAPPESDMQILDDYVKSASMLKEHADYLTFNMSCPNTEMGRDFFADKEHIVRFLTVLNELDITCPVFLKISPLGGVETIEKYLEAADGFDLVSGFIFNLAPGHNLPLKTPGPVLKNMPGALSGRPVEKSMNYCITEMYKRMDRGRYSIIGAGGVFTAEDAFRKITLGASLVQILTGMVYNGPSVVKSINQGLLHILDREGFGNISEAVGAAH